MSNSGVLDCKAEGRTFVSEEYDDKEDALVHVKSLNERYWLEWRAGIDAQIAIRTAREQSAPPPSSRVFSSLWTRLKAVFHPSHRSPRVTANLRAW